MFNKYYAEALATDFEGLSLQEQIKYVKHLYKVMKREREMNSDGIRNRSSEIITLLYYTCTCTCVCEYIIICL